MSKQLVGEWENSNLLFISPAQMKDHIIAGVLTAYDIPCSDRKGICGYMQPIDPSKYYGFSPHIVPHASGYTINFKTICRCTADQRWIKSLSLVDANIIKNRVWELEQDEIG